MSCCSSWGIEMIPSLLFVFLDSTKNPALHYTSIFLLTICSALQSVNSKVQFDFPNLKKAKFGKFIFKRKRVCFISKLSSNNFFWRSVPRVGFLLSWPNSSHFKKVWGEISEPPRVMSRFCCRVIFIHFPYRFSSCSCPFQESQLWRQTPPRSQLWYLEKNNQFHSLSIFPYGSFRFAVMHF